MASIRSRWRYGTALTSIRCRRRAPRWAWKISAKRCQRRALMRTSNLEFAYRANLPTPSRVAVDTVASSSREFNNLELTIADLMSFDPLGDAPCNRLVRGASCGGLSALTGVHVLLLHTHW